MDAVATLSSSAKENTGGNDPMSDDDVLASLLRGQAVQKDVQDALSRCVHVNIWRAIYVKAFSHATAPLS